MLGVDWRMGFVWGWGLFGWSRGGDGRFETSASTRGVLRAQTEIQQKQRMRREMKTDTENCRTSIAQHSIA